MFTINVKISTDDLEILFSDKDEAVVRTKKVVGYYGDYLCHTVYREVVEAHVMERVDDLSKVSRTPNDVEEAVIRGTVLTIAANKFCHQLSSDLHRKVNGGSDD